MGTFIIKNQVGFDNKVFYFGMECDVRVFDPRGLIAQ